MTVTGERRRALWIPPDVAARFDQLKLIAEEPAHRVLTRLMDEHDARLAGGRVPPEVLAAMMGTSAHEPGTSARGTLHGLSLPRVTEAEP